MAFLETPRFEGCPSLGYTSAPTYANTVVRMASGREKRNRVNSRPLHVFNCTVGPRASADVEAVRTHFHAVGGRDCGFRFKDLADYKSCALMSSTISALDAPLVSLGGSPLTYQLTKRYTKGARTQDRDIYKPVDGTIVVANQAGVIQASSTYSIDYTTGILTPNGTFSGTPTTWGGEFDTPVRFNEDELNVVVEDREIQSVSFGLSELRL